MSANDHYELVEHNYGKGSVKLLHIQRDGYKHSIRELEVSTSLTLNNVIDYTHGDNRDIVATDTQKNTVYILAKKHGVTTPEDFGMLLCRHFLDTYSHVVQADVKVEVYPWERITMGNVPHNHAFIFNPQSFRTANVTQKRYGVPRISASLTGLRILKTTQSAFVGFVRDDYTTLPEAPDRVFSTIVESNWDYNTTAGIDFDKAWESVKMTILEKFAGPSDVGIASPSVQNTLYLAEKTILDNIKQIDSIEMVMPNKHYFTVDFTRFPEKLSQGSGNREVLQPVDKPSGVIRAKMSRKDIRSKL